MQQEHPVDTPFDPIPEVIAAVQRGEIVVVTDDEHRENEGDLICAAEKISPEGINFMASHGKGLICVAMQRKRLLELGLSRMPARGAGDPFHTAFVQSVDAAHGVTTGISVHDRAQTIRALLDPETRPDDLVSPGHVFPLEAVAEGVLRRPGHTEAAVDLARLSGLKPAGVICEILRDDGKMARMDYLRDFAKRHKLKFTSVADLVAYRRHKEMLVVRETSVNMPTDFGLFELHMYHSLLDGEHHLALVKGEPQQADAPLVRIHSECLTGDVFGSQRCDCGSQLKESMRRMAEEGAGVLLYMRQEGRGIGLAHKIQAYALQEQGLDTVEANQRLGFEADLRDYGISAQMLRDIGVVAVRLLTNNPAKISGLQRFGIEVVERVPLVLPCTPYNEKYLKTKKAKLGHLL